MFRPVLGHFIVMPFLLGFLPWLTYAAFDTRFLGFLAVCIPWIFGPIAKGRTKFIVEKNFKTGDFIRILLLVALSCIAGNVIGGFTFTPSPVV